MNSKGLFLMFSNFGVIKDVFIPSKRRKATRSRFGFVRFDCPLVTGVSIQKTDGIWCDNKILKAKRADFGKEKLSKEYHEPIKDLSGVVRDPRGRSAYAEVVRGGAMRKENELSIHAEEYGNGWLFNSQVFCLFPIVNILAGKGTILARKGTTEANSRRQKAHPSSKQ
ncbi:hypothetical protein ACSBR2_013167 [Camellia fascicularis]